MFRKDFAEMWLLEKFVQEEFMEGELLFFLYFYSVLFEGVLQQPMGESDNFLLVSFRMCSKCINIVVEVALEKKIQMFLGEYEKVQSKTGVEDASVLLRLLMNNSRAEAAKRKEKVMKALPDAIRRGFPSI